MTLIESITGASITAMTLVGGVACFVSGMMSWTKGAASIEAMSKSQNAVKLMSQHLREAYKATVSTDGKQVTFQIPSKNPDGSYVIPMVSDNIDRIYKINNSNELVYVVGGSTTIISKNILATDPATNASYRVFNANAGSVSRQLVIQLVTTRQGFRNNWEPNRTRESVYLRNIPQLSR
jgi:hypothetical protein